jgi:hypothetical protein
MTLSQDDQSLSSGEEADNTQTAGAQRQVVATAPALNTSQ